jgi:hypothetical protein
MNYRDKERVLTSKLVQNFNYRGAHMGRLALPAVLRYGLGLALSLT